MDEILLLIALVSVLDLLDQHKKGHVDHNFTKTLNVYILIILLISILIPSTF